MRVSNPTHSSTSSNGNGIISETTTFDASENARILFLTTFFSVILRSAALGLLLVVVAVACSVYANARSSEPTSKTNRMTTDLSKNICSIVPSSFESFAHFFPPFRFLRTRNAISTLYRRRSAVSLDVSHARACVCHLYSNAFVVVVRGTISPQFVGRCERAAPRASGPIQSIHQIIMFE